MIKSTAAIALLTTCASSPACSWSGIRNLPAETTSPLPRLAQTPDGAAWGATWKTRTAGRHKPRWTHGAASVRQNVNPTLADLQVASDGTAIVLRSDDVEHGLRQISADGTVSVVLNLPFARIASACAPPRAVCWPRSPTASTAWASARQR